MKPWECSLLARARMTLQLISEYTGRKYQVTRRILAKLLHLAQKEGWRPERVSLEGSTESCETSIVLSHLAPYLSGRVSRTDAEGLRIALTRALATGTVAAEGVVQFTAGTLLQVAREGPFLVRSSELRPLESQSLDDAVPA